MHVIWIASITHFCDSDTEVEYKYKQLAQA